MSELVVPFLYELRARRLPVGAQEAVQLARALALGLHENSLDGFYYVSRALMVHRESDLDKFDEAFLSHFKGVVFETTSFLKELEDWLKDPKILQGLTEEQKAALEELDIDELRELLEQRLREQKERHEGGNRWIGTGGTSPFGTGGHHPTGISMRSGSGGRGGRSAMGMADARRYRPYRSDLVLDVRQIEVALRKLRSFTREGAVDELDLDGTIDATAKNGGELEIVTRPPRRSNVRVLLLMDVGGSMDPFAHTCSQLFSAAKRASNFRELRTYYFHNTIYGRVYSTDGLMDPIEVPRLVDQLNARWKVIFVGDAAMAPGELLGTGPWGSPAGGQTLSGLDWLMYIQERFERTVWLNPDPPQYWSGGTAKGISELFSMHHLTLEGLTEAMAHLSKAAARRGLA
ncbi:MAG: VWA domain-containing protein [Polyangiaceae bacterium]|nr:VWA domain-containing protein [Polyangiaceae bacterium]MCE7895035.1 VWA domain-containing protein [Sorangiineae bacterium PRO1]